MCKFTQIGLNIKALVLGVLLGVFSFSSLAASQTAIKSLVINYQDTPDATVVANQGLPVATSALRLDASQIQEVNSRNPAAIAAVNQCPKSGSSATLISKNGELSCANGKILGVQTKEITSSSVGNCTWCN